MHKPAPLSRLLILLCIVATLLPGCAVTNRLFRDRAAEERAAALLQTQLAVMRFADEYTARVNAQVGVFQQATNDPGERLESQAWLVSQATAAFTIASGPNPELNAIDMLVFTTLSRMVIEDRWVGELYGARANGLLAEHRALETRIWDYARVLLTEAQTSELRSSIEAWHRRIRSAAPCRSSTSRTLRSPRARPAATPPRPPASSRSSASIRSATSIQRARAGAVAPTGQRAVYYGQRAPMLVSMEAQRLAFELAVAPESVRLIDSVARIGNAAQTTSVLAADLPNLLAAERAATIDQLTGILDERQGS